MASIFQINPGLDVPIYQQLVDEIRAGVKKGTLQPGQQLPTVQELAGQLSIARGTIKRAYDELEHLGVLEKIQGRGTFVCYQPENSPSRKEQAMAAIDNMLDRLEEMGFSQMEIDIFLSLKQRERAEKLSRLKVAVVECNPENLSQLSEQLRRIKGIELYSYLLGTVRDYPYNLDEDMDLVITTGTHGEYIASILSDRQKLTRVALRMSLDTMSGIMRLRPGESVAIVAGSKRFGDLVHSTCQQYTKGVSLSEPRLFSQKPDLLEKDKVLVPKDYEKYCLTEDMTALQKLDEEGRLILCSYEMDAGSDLHLEEKLRQLRECKN